MKVQLPHIVSFSDVARFGSLGKAAARTDVSEATLSRHIKSLENDLGVVLFERTSTGLMLTREGRELIEHADGILDATHNFLFAASCANASDTQVARITMSEGVTFSLGPWLVAKCRKAFPEIRLEIVPSDNTLDLLAGDADIALRMFRPLQENLTATRLGDHLVGAFASEDYLLSHGTPETLDDFLHHDVIGGDDSEEVLRGFRTLGYALDPTFFKVRCNCRTLAWQFVLKGVGIGFARLSVGSNTPGVRRLLPDLPPVRQEIWAAMRAGVSPESATAKIYDLIVDLFRTTPEPPLPAEP